MLDVEQLVHPPALVGAGRGADVTCVFAAGACWGGVEVPGVAETAGRELTGWEWVRLTVGVDAMLAPLIAPRVAAAWIAAWRVDCMGARTMALEEALGSVRLSEATEPR